MADAHNWKEFGGPDLPVVPVVRPPTSGTRDTFRKYVLRGGDEGKVTQSDSSELVKKTVAETPGAIGYLALSVLDTTVHPIAINNYSPTRDNIIAGHYTFWSYEHMYTLGDDNALISDFLYFMLTPTVQRLAQKESYIPIADIKLPETTTPTAASTSHALVNPGQRSDKGDSRG